jgi:hypothetical protein
MLALAAILTAGTATVASACGLQASLDNAGFATAAASQNLSAASKKNMTKPDTAKKTMSEEKMMKRSTTGAPAAVNNGH